MTESIQRLAYPTHVLPLMLRDFVDRVVVATQSTPEMVVPVMLAGMSAAVQGVVDVKTPYGEVMPASLFACVIAKSGDRKSSVLKKVMEGFEDFERGRLTAHVVPGWGDQERLKHHQFLIEDATSKGVIDIFKGGAYSLFYALDEAALLFKNLDMPSLCKRFDGSAINEVSRTHGASILHDTRVALCMLTQDVTFNRFVSKKGDLLVESGLMPRMLISQATAQYGPNRWLPVSLSEESLERHAFHQRVKELMREYAKSVGRPEIRRQQIGFSPSVAVVWERYTQQVQAMVGTGATWSDLRAFMLRSGELVCRVAVVLQHFVEPSKQEVQQWAATAATEIVAWHLCEAKRMFGEGAAELKFQRDVDAFYEYLLRRANRTGQWFVARSELLRYAPIAMRSADVLDNAIEKLSMTGKVTESMQGRKKYILINKITNNVDYTQFSFGASSPLICF